MITWINSQLAISGWEDRTDPIFDVVVSICSSTEAQERWCNIPDKVVIHINHLDREPGLASKIERILHILEAYLDRGFRVLIHCNKGRSRSVTAAIMIMSIIYRLPFEYSYKVVMEARARHADPQPWHGFIAEAAGTVIHHRLTMARLARTALQCL